MVREGESNRSHLCPSGSARGRRVGSARGGLCWLSHFAASFPSWGSRRQPEEVAVLPQCWGWRWVQGEAGRLGRGRAARLHPPPRPRGWRPAPKLRRGGRTHVLSFHRPRAFPPAAPYLLHPRSPPQRRRLLPAVPPGQPLRCRCGEEGSGRGEMAAGARRPPRHLLPPGPPPCTPAPLPLPPSSAPVPASSRRCRVAAAAKDEPGPTAGAGPPRQPRRGPSLPLGAAPEQEKRAAKKRASGGTRSPAGAPGHVGAEQQRSRKYRAGWGNQAPDGLCRRPGTAAGNF